MISSSRQPGYTNIFPLEKYLHEMLQQRCAKIIIICEIPKQKLTPISKLIFCL